MLRSRGFLGAYIGVLLCLSLSLGESSLKPHERIIAPSKPLKKAFVPTDEQCLAATLYYEARGETKRGQQLIAAVVLNRAKASGKSVCSVVKQRKQFSWMNGKTHIPTSKKHEPLLPIAKKYMNKFHKGQWKEIHITHFHSKGVFPTWAEKLTLVYVEGNHLFYSSKEKQNERS